MSLNDHLYAENALPTGPIRFFELRASPVYESNSGSIIFISPVYLNCLERNGDPTVGTYCCVLCAERTHWTNNGDVNVVYGYLRLFNKNILSTTSGFRIIFTGNLPVPLQTVFTGRATAEAVVCFSLRWPGFAHGTDHVGFVHKMALGQVCLRGRRFPSDSIIPPLLHIHSYIIWGMDKEPVRGHVPQRQCLTP
jgi:hypothetical protein